MKRIVLSASLLAASAPASAQVVNGSFSSGIFGWFASGDATVRDGAGFLTNASASADDDNLGAGFFNHSGLEPAFADELETDLGLAIDALSPDVGGSVIAYEGSALFQSITVQAGDILSFDWTFLTNEAAGADYAFLVIDGALIDFSSGFTLSAGSTYGYDFTSGAQTYQSAPFASAGTVLIGFGVVDVNSFVGSSALAFDNVTLTAIPEPSSFAALAGLATLGLAASRRRRR